jgi:hypothetical protein
MAVHGTTFPSVGGPRKVGAGEPRASPRPVRPTHNLSARSDSRRGRVGEAAYGTVIADA